MKKLNAMRETSKETSLSDQPKVLNCKRAFRVRGDDRRKEDVLNVYLLEW